MMENKTAEQIFQKHLEASFDNGIRHKYFIGAMEEYASQQCLDMQAEIDRLKAVLAELKLSPETNDHYERYILTKKGEDLFEALNSKQ